MSQNSKSHLCKIKVQILYKLQTSGLKKRHTFCHMVRRTMLVSSLQELLEMSTFGRTHARRHLTPLVNCIVNHARVHGVSNVQQTLLQFVNAVQLRLMHLLLDVTPYLVIDRINFGAIRRPQIWRNKSGCWLLKNRSVACPVCRCAVLLKDEEIAWHVAYHRQQLLRREHVAVAAVDL